MTNQPGSFCSCLNNITHCTDRRRLILLSLSSSILSAPIHDHHIKCEIVMSHIYDSYIYVWIIDVFAGSIALIHFYTEFMINTRKSNNLGLCTIEKITISGNTLQWFINKLIHLFQPFTLITFIANLNLRNIL